MVMTKRGFSIIAEVIKSEVDKVNPELENARFESLSQVAQGIARHGNDANVHFDRREFLTACGFNDEGTKW